MKSAVSKSAANYSFSVKCRGQSILLVSGVSGTTGTGPQHLYIIQNTPDHRRQVIFLTFCISWSIFG